MATWDNIKKLMKMSKQEVDTLAEPSIMDDVRTNPEQDELIELAKGQKAAIENSLTNPTTGIVSKSQVGKVLANIKNPSRESVLEAISENSPTNTGRTMLELRERIRDANSISALEEAGLTGKKLNEDTIRDLLQKRDPKLIKKLNVEFDPSMEQVNQRGLADFEKKLIKLQTPDASTAAHELAHFQDIAKDPNFRSRPINLIDTNYKKNPTLEALDFISKGHHRTPYFELDDTTRILNKISGKEATKKEVDELLDLLNNPPRGSQEDIFKDPRVKGTLVKPEPIAPMDIKPLLKKR